MQKGNRTDQVFIPCCPGKFELAQFEYGYRLRNKSSQLFFNTILLLIHLAPVENLTVTNFSSFRGESFLNFSISVVSWNSPPFFKSRRAFQVIYYDEHNSDTGDELVEEVSVFIFSCIKLY